MLDKIKEIFKPEDYNEYKILTAQDEFSDEGNKSEDNLGGCLAPIVVVLILLWLVFKL